MSLPRSPPAAFFKSVCLPVVPFVRCFHYIADADAKFRAWLFLCFLYFADSSLARFRARLRRRRLDSVDVYLSLGKEVYPTSSLLLPVVNRSP